MRPIGRLVLDRTVDNFFAETEQVAFCTANIVPAIDFTNDPLLQGRNFSYLDTQLKRLGGPNFTHLPVNAPKCPVAHFQQDGHMAMHEPVGPGELRAELVDRRRDGTTRGSRGGFRDRCTARGGRHATGPAGDLRRPLQPGPPVLRESDPDRAGRTSSTRSCSNCPRSSEPDDPLSAWSPTCATSTRRSPPRSQRASGCDDLPEPREPRQRPDRPAGVSGAEHPGERARRRSSDASWECSSPMAVTPGCSPGCARRPRRPEPSSSSSPRRSVVSRRRTASCTRPTGRSTAALGVVRRRSPSSRVGRAPPGSPPTRRRSTSSVTHTPTASSSPFGDDASELLTAAGVADLIDDGYVTLDAKPASATSFLHACTALRFWDREPTLNWRQVASGDAPADAATLPRPGGAG